MHGGKDFVEKVRLIKKLFPFRYLSLAFGKFAHIFAEN